MVRTALVYALALSLSGAAAAQDWSAQPANEVAGITLPRGFTATVFADGLGPTRHLAVAGDGTVYVAMRRKTDGGGILALRDEDGDGTADVTRAFGDAAGTGIAIHDGHLYFGSDTQILRWPLPETGLVPQGAPEVVVTGFPEQRQHATKPIAFDESGHLYVAVGAPSNACQARMRTPGSPGLDPCPQLKLQAGIWRYDADQAGQRHDAANRFSTGIRNGLAIDWNAAADVLYFATHGRDQLHYLFPEHFTVEENARLPAEEFHKAADGADYGWPYAYWDSAMGSYMEAPEYGGDGQTRAEADKYRAPLVAFPAHWSPNDLFFYAPATAFPEYFHNGAFIAWHGSWNRAPLPQEGYKITFVPMTAAGEVAGDWIVFADGFKGKETLESPAAAEYRPTGLAVGPDGALYISEDQKGRIWKVTYAGG